MQLLALDPALNCTGWAVFDDGTLVKTGVFEQSPKDGTQDERLVEIRIRLFELIDDFRIMRVAAERGYRGVLSDVRGVLRELTQYLVGEPLTLYTPAEWQSSVGAYKKGRRGLSMKERVREIIVDYLGKHGYPYASMTQDEMDAIGVGLAYLREHAS